MRRSMFAFASVMLFAPAIAQQFELGNPDQDLEPFLESFNEAYPHSLEVGPLPEQLASAGSLFECDGYLTANPTDNFCSSTVPEDWEAFEFNGETFYKVPLKGVESEMKVIK